MTDPRNSEDANLAGELFIAGLAERQSQQPPIDIETQDTTGWQLIPGGIAIPTPVGKVFIPEARREELRYYSSRFPLRPTEPPAPRPAASPSGISVVGGWCDPEPIIGELAHSEGDSPGYRDPRYRITEDIPSRQRPSVSAAERRDRDEHALIEQSVSLIQIQPDVGPTITPLGLMDAIYVKPMRRVEDILASAGVSPIGWALSYTDKEGRPYLLRVAADFEEIVRARNNMTENPHLYKIVALVEVEN